MTIDKIVHLGRVVVGNSRHKACFCHINYDGKSLSIMGIIGPTAHGNCVSCGQIRLEKESFVSFGNGWNQNKVNFFARIWKFWHLNDMRAGDAMQEMALADGVSRDYQQACEHLKTLDLLVHDGYEYGSRWKYQPVPKSIVNYLAKLPDSELTPAWC